MSWNAVIACAAQVINAALPVILNALSNKDNDAVAHIGPASLYMVNDKLYLGNLGNSQNGTRDGTHINVTMVSPTSESNRTMSVLLPVGMGFHVDPYLVGDYKDGEFSINSSDVVDDDNGKSLIASLLFSAYRMIVAGEPIHVAAGVEGRVVVEAGRSVFLLMFSGVASVAALMSLNYWLNGRNVGGVNGQQNGQLPPPVQNGNGADATWTFKLPMPANVDYSLGLTALELKIPVIVDAARQSLIIEPIPPHIAKKGCSQS